jgi:hypothetical protein
MPTGGLSVTFVGLTNNVSGVTLAQFDVTNAFRQRVQFGVCEVQIRDTNGWPGYGRVAGGAGWLALAAGSHRVVSVPAPSLEGATWRVPLSYLVEPPFVDEMRNRIRDWAVITTRWRPGRTVIIRRRTSSSCIYGPEMGVSNQPVQRTEASSSAQETNQPSAAAASRRSP